MDEQPLVAIIQTNEEIAELLQLTLQSEDIRTVGAFTTDFKRGRQDLATFLRSYDPGVVLWDIAIPYDENWAFFTRMRQSPEGQGRRYIITTTNKRVLASVVGETEAREIIGKPYDLEALVDAVRRALAPDTPP